MPTLSTKNKVTIGYLLLTLLLIATMIYTYSEVRLLTKSDDYSTQLSMRRQATTDIINHLNTADIIGQAIAIGETEEYDNYSKATAQAVDAVKQLRTLTHDPVQELRIDTVAMLIYQKGENMRDLMAIIEKINELPIYEEQIEAIAAIHDSLHESSTLATGQRKKTVSRTYIKPAKQESFLKRLGKLFSPTKADTTIVNDTIYEEYLPTAQKTASVTDTITAILRNAQSRATQNRIQQMHELSNHMQRLRLGSLNLSQRVNHLLSSIEEENHRAMLTSQQQREEIRLSSAYTIATIATVAVLLAGIFLFLIWRDITRSTHYRKELEKANRQAEELLDTREKLMLTVTHDIKAPIGNIQGYTELLGNITTDERQQFYLQNISDSTGHLLELVRSLLDFHRLDARKMEKQNIPFNIKEMLDKIANGYSIQATNRQLQLEYECDNTLNGIFTGDPLRIRQIIENLLNNALKFTKQGEVSLKATYDTTTEEIQLTISDTGCGIAPEEQQQIFKEFTRLQNAQGKEGFGLGLAITYKLVQLLQGNIQLQSIEGSGSTFIVTLPLPQAPGISTATMPEEKHATSHIEAKLLLIDDDPLQLQLTTAMLQEYALSVTCCSHPDELFIHLQQQKFDLILTDIQMPAMNGIELLQKIREMPNGKKTPIIAITARSDISSDTFHSHGFTASLNKPFTNKELHAAIAAALDGKQLDFGQLTLFASGDNAAATQIMETFIEETGNKKEQLLQAKDKHDMQLATKITHQLLPIFRMLEETDTIPHLMWFEEHRDQKEMTPRAIENLETIIAATSVIIREAAKQLPHNIK